jgi:hypothetical protein
MQGGTSSRGNAVLLELIAGGKELGSSFGCEWTIGRGVEKELLVHLEGGAGRGAKDQGGSRQ